RVQPTVQHYHKFRNELTEYRGLIYKRDKLIIPLNCRADLLPKLYYGHFGVNKTRNRARLCFYWPGMARDVEKMVLSCHICMTPRKNNPRDPLISHDIPNRPWKKVACDLFNIGRDAYLLVVDYYSKYIEIAKLEDSTSSNQVMVNLKSIFARHGIPDVVMSDNLVKNGSFNTLRPAHYIHSRTA
ncbi:hypothetical protein ILUMI_14324, partial [Ignelater luminosus]